jgi:FlaA1/EpsC-like NDP-sugar epimerase
MDQLTARFLHQSRSYLAVVCLMAADIFSLLSAMAVSLLLRFEDQPLANIYLAHIQTHMKSLPLILGLYVALFALFRLYRCAWRFASLEMVWGIVCANSIGLAGMVTLQHLIDLTIFPRSVLIIFWVMSLLMVGCVRVLLRLVNIGRNYGQRLLKELRNDAPPKRVVILGCEANGARLLATLQEDIREPYEVLGFLDDAPLKHGMYIRGVRVLGPLEHLYKLLDTNAVDEVLIAIPEGAGANIREYVLACRKRQVPVKTIPGLRDVLSGKTHARLEEISVEDLLRRPPVRINIAEIGSYLTGKRVLVSGAGGSIGSELCRQILALNPAALILLGHGENSIYRIHQELLGRHPELAARIHVIIASVSDEPRIEATFRTHTPQVVFHAAAHKHVPMMEVNVPEAIQNNVLGTRTMAKACGRYQTERMVLISTDKAVYPSSVMGATKWLCEEVVRAMADLYPTTTFVTVRFGNVLGSRGSVVPLFREQIARRGPVTVTHPEITRYFMTIPEAVQLVLQAGAIGKSGELYLLDMGKPVQITDLARDMIRLSGFEPDVDISIIFTGLRPGEKLHERLAMEEESLMPAPCEGLSIVHRPHYFASAEFRSLLGRMEQWARNGEQELLLEMLGELVPSFGAQRLLEGVIDTPPATVATA